MALITLVFALGLQVAPAQFQPPVLLSTTASQDGSTVTAAFNEPLWELAAEDPFNYFITGSDGSFIDFFTATLEADQQTVTLAPTTTFMAGVAYTFVAFLACDVTLECTNDQSVPLIFQGMPTNLPPAANSQSVIVEANTPTPITLSGPIRMATR